MGYHPRRDTPLIAGNLKRAVVVFGAFGVNFGNRVSMFHNFTSFDAEKVGKGYVVNEGREGGSQDFFV